METFENGKWRTWNHFVGTGNYNFVEYYIHIIHRVEDDAKHTTQKPKS
jgi:hypothetical protein